MAERNFANQTILCIKANGLFEENKYYFCFADSGDVFWIHAPFLLDRIGVDQIKVPCGLREFFITEEEYHANKQRYLTG